MNSSWKPNLFVPGFPQCGTTALCDYLRFHPDIYFLDLKEPDTLAIGEPYPALGKKHPYIKKPYYYYLDYEKYKKEFELHRGQRYRAEGSQDYIWPPAFPKRIKRFSPDAKLIFMIRNQKPRLLSIYFQTFEKHLEANFLNWIKKHFLPVKELYFFSDMLRSYYELFGGESIRVVKNDSLAAHPQHIFDQICNFLDLSHVAITPLHSNVNRLKSLSESQRRNVSRYMRISKTVTLPVTYFINSTEIGRMPLWSRVRNSLSKIPVTQDQFEQRVVDERNSDETRMLASIPQELVETLEGDFQTAVNFCDKNRILVL
jgi:Sulfotransferase family